MKERLNNIFQLEQKENPSGKPYVVSADIRYLLKKWASQKNFLLPDEVFFQRLRDKFSNYMGNIFEAFDLVKEEEISNGLADLVNRTGLHPLSLDGIYYDCESKLEITRLVDEDLTNKGLSRRFGTPLLLKQIRKIQSLKEQNIREVVLVDDVIFSGNLITRVKNILAKIGIQTPVVCAGVGIGDGINRLQESFREIKCVRYYRDVIDEVCERDFYPGVPQSGRLVVGNFDMGAPYIHPFGRPSEWASIPEEWTTSVSYFCLRQSIDLFQGIEKASGRPVLCQDLGRYVISLPQDANRYVDVLQEKLSVGQLSKIKPYAA